LLDQILGYLVETARWLLVLILGLVSPGAFSPWTGTVVKIVRPDEIKVQKAENEIINVRIYGVDCPLVESGQFFGKDAFRYTSERLMGKIVKVQPLPGRIEGKWYWPGIRHLDRLHWEKNAQKYNRVIGLVYIDHESFGKELLSSGTAWWYKPFVPYERGYKYLEDQAKEAKLGLWAYPDPVPPWKYQNTPVVDGRSKTREWVHFWVRKDDSSPGKESAVPIAPVGPSENSDKSFKQKTEHQMPKDSTAPEVDISRNRIHAVESPPVSQPTNDLTENAEKNEKQPQIATQKPIPPCHVILKELQKRMAKKESASVAEFQELLGPSDQECRNGNEKIYCFKCTVIGRKTDFIQAIEKDGLISNFRYGECNCSSD
jgi:endonuclease YncB( thermonuclease family)